jgi:hypothetical protein
MQSDYKFSKSKLWRFIILNLTFFTNPFLISIGKYPLSDIFIMFSIFIGTIFLEILLIIWQKNNKNIFQIIIILFVINFYNFTYFLLPYLLLTNLILVTLYVTIFTILLKSKSHRFTIIFICVFLTTALYQGLYFKGNLNNVTPISQKYKAKKNIYIIGIDGMISSKIFYKYFKKESEATRKLKDKGFSIFDIESAGKSTLETYSSLISYSSSIDIPPRKWREIISDKKSKFYEDLNSLGYKKQFTYANNYFGQDPNKVYDDYFPKNTTVMGFCNYVDNRWGWKICNIYNYSIKKELTSDPFNIFFKRANRVFHKKDKWLSIFHIWFPGHSSNNFNARKENEFNIYKNYYLNSQKKLSKDFEKITNYILSNDPDAVIVFVGDHGSFLLRGLEPGDSLKSIGQLIDLDFKLDNTDVLLAIYPKEIGEKVMSKKRKPALLFRSIIEASNE